MAQSSLAKRVAALEADMQVMKTQLDHAQAVAGIERGIRVMNRNDGMPARAALQAFALADIELAYEWLAERSPLNTPKWHIDLADAITSLEENPLRCPLGRENEQVSEETRQLLFGSKRHAYRIFFTIRNDTVWVTHVRHGARA